MQKINTILYLGQDYSISSNAYYATPQDYGAVGNGTTDDTQAIQRCIDENYTVCFPKGHYLITSPITLSHNQCTIFGANRENTRIKCSGCEGFVFPSGRSHVKISELLIYGSDATNNNGILFEGSASHICFDHIQISGFGLSGICSNSANTGHVTNLSVGHSIIKNCLYGIEIISTSTAQKNVIHIHDCTIDNHTHGIVITGNGITIDNNDIENCEYAIVVDSTYSNNDSSYKRTQSISIIENYVDHVKDGFIKANSHYISTDDGLIDGLTVIGNYVYISSNFTSMNLDPVIDLKSSADPYRPGMGTEGITLANMNCFGNVFSYSGAGVYEKILIDGGNVLKDDSVFRFSHVGATTSSSYIIQNMGTAEVYPQLT